MEMHQIRYFLAVAQTLNFTRAADQCNVTQPSLTRAIQKLEDEFGGSLFNRERAMTHLTELGRMVLPHLQQTLEAAEAATLLAGSIGRAEVTPLVIGIANGVKSAVLDDILASLGHAMSGLALDLRSGTSDELVAASMKGGFDLLVVSLPDEANNRIEIWPLYEASYRIAISSRRRLAEEGPVTTRDILGEPWIDCADDGTALWRRLASGSGQDLQFRHRVERRDQALRLIALQLGVGLMPSETQWENVTMVDSADRDLTYRVVLAAIGGRQRGRAAEAFLRAARARDWQASATV